MRLRCAHIEAGDEYVQNTLIADADWADFPKQMVRRWLGRPPQADGSLWICKGGLRAGGQDRDEPEGC